VLMLL